MAARSQGLFWLDSEASDCMSSRNCSTVSNASLSADIALEASLQSSAWRAEVMKEQACSQLHIQRHNPGQHLMTTHAAPHIQALSLR